MYKNNCIRTQKKQKVFYWYSVPHDRLFLDALERDLKREKMGQEATTVAVNEPALSFEFDSSQSLFEQLTKAQQANTSSFSANASSAYSQSTSPVMRAVDSMPPPQMVPQPMPTVTEEITQPIDTYSQVSMPSTVATNFVKREQDYGQLQYDRNGIPLTRVHQRHTSMPTYMEYSPAPSFVSSQYEDYSNRGISFEPITPPQQTHSLGAEPAYIANEDTGLYTAIPDVNSAPNFNSMMQLPTSNLSGTQYSASGRNYPGNNVYSVIEARQRISSGDGDRRFHPAPLLLLQPRAMGTHTQFTGRATSAAQFRTLSVQYQKVKKPSTTLRQHYQTGTRI